MRIKKIKKKCISIIASSLIIMGSFGTGLIHATDIEKTEIESSIDPRYTAGTEDWRLISSSQKILSNKYTGTVTKSSTIAFNAGVNIKGVDVGASKTYSSSKKFKTYRRTRDITAKFAVYSRMGHFIRYETQTRRITTTHHVAI